jgi:hypothetical protein
VVALTNFDADAQFWPTFLDCGKPYPDQAFTALIYVADPAKVRTPGITLQRVCVTGLVRDDRGEPEFSPNDSSQLAK